MNIKKVLSENPVAIFLKMLPPYLNYLWKFSNNNARCQNSENSNKQLTDILMLTHALEKAFSLPNPRKQFGLQKAKQLVEKVGTYINKFGYSTNLNVSLAVLTAYIHYHKKNGVDIVDIQDIDHQLKELITISGLKSKDLEIGGSYCLRSSEQRTGGRKSFNTLVENRFSIRNFSGKPVEDTLIYNALDLAKKSPSACNRQAYRVHVFRGEEKNDLLKIQGGASSFFESADAVLLLAADSNRYYTRELFLGYVDVSLFAMALMFSFTYLGIGSIPLTLGISPDKLKMIKTKFSIPKNEVPVLLIAIGNYPDNFKVAKSYRNSVETFTKFH